MDEDTGRRRDDLLDAVAWLRASILEDQAASAVILEHADFPQLVDDVTGICLSLLSECRDTDSLLRVLDGVRWRTEWLAVNDPPQPRPDDDDRSG